MRRHYGCGRVLDSGLDRNISIVALERLFERFVAHAAESQEGLVVNDVIAVAPLNGPIEIHAKYKLSCNLQSPIRRNHRKFK